jgi:hypothetical protein
VTAGPKNQFYFETKAGNPIAAGLSREILNCAFMISVVIADAVLNWFHQLRSVEGILN